MELSGKPDGVGVSIWQFRENKVGKVGHVVKVIGLLGTNSSLYAV